MLLTVFYIFYENYVNFFYYNLLTITLRASVNMTLYLFIGLLLNNFTSLRRNKIRVQRNLPHLQLWCKNKIL